MYASFVLAALVGVYLVAVGGAPIAAIGVASIAAGIAYTGGPYPLGYHGLGDIAVLAFFGPVAVCGTVYAETGHVGALAATASLASGALATAVLVVNNVRDELTDRVAGKRTLVVRFGRAFGAIEYAALLAAAQLVVIAMVVTELAPPIVLATLVLAPRGVSLARDVARGLALDRALPATARLMCAHGALLAGTLVLATR
jgi:1,4-dihydroxy-2-naphthoate octaprenyltransferase